MSREKVYIIIAGVNGAGKSTLYHSDYNIGDFFDFCDDSILHRLQRVNVDEILREFGDWRNPADFVKAGRIAVKQVLDCFQDGVSFCQESTLCGRWILKNIDTAKRLGYKVGIIYVGIDNAELAIQRISNRVSKGGHGVSDSDVRQRFFTSLNNLNAVAGKCDGILFFDNTNIFRPVAAMTNQKLRLVNSIDPLPSWFKNHINLPIAQDRDQNISSLDLRRNCQDPGDR